MQTPPQPVSYSQLRHPPLRLPLLSCPPKDIPPRSLHPPPIGSFLFSIGSGLSAYKRAVISPIFQNFLLTLLLLPDTTPLLP